MTRYITLSILVVFMFGCQTQSDGIKPDYSDVDWEFIEIESHITHRTKVVSQYQPPKTGGVLWFKIDQSRPPKTVELFGNKNAQIAIKVNVIDVISYFESHYKKYPNLKGEKALADRFSKELKTHSEYFCHDFTSHEQDRLLFCLANLLEKGKTYIRDRNGQVYTTFFACKWEDIRGSLMSAGGRIFFLADGRKFFYTMDWI